MGMDARVSIAMRGCAALIDAIDAIGEPNHDDHSLAQIVCDNEMELRELIAWFRESLAQ